MRGKQLSDLPDHLIQAELFPWLHPSDFLALAACNKLLRVLAESDGLYWKKALGIRFQFTVGSEETWYNRYIWSNPGTTLARAAVFKAIFKALSDPAVYIWGSNELGSISFPIPEGWRDRLGVISPVHQVIAGGRVTDITAGKWCYTALNSRGEIIVWGALNSANVRQTHSIDNPNFFHPWRRLKYPTLLRFPARFQQVKYCNTHCAALDNEGCIWNFACWSHPFKLKTSMRNPTSQSILFTQVDCGLGFSCALTKNGDLYIWQLIEGKVFGSIRSQILRMADQAGATVMDEEQKTIRCVGWEFSLDAIRVSDLPPLPIIGPNATATAELKLVKIVAMRQSIIGLSNKGHVLVSMASSWDSPDGPSWLYLPFYSTWNSRGRGELDHLNSHIETYVATDITAHDNRFAVWSKGGFAILVGQLEFVHDPAIVTIPVPVASVVLGEVHGAIVTEDGKLYTFGLNRHGSLGLGFFEDSSRRPLEVQFTHDGGREIADYYCLGAGAGGNHTGALVVDLTEK